jgi:hypothetical protein
MASIPGERMKEQSDEIEKAWRRPARGVRTRRGHGELRLRDQQLGAKPTVSCTSAAKNSREKRDKYLTEAVVLPRNLSFSLFGASVHFTWTTVKAITKTLTESASPPRARVKGSSVYSGVSLTGSAGCSTPSTLTTKELTTTVGMNKAGTVVTFQIQPTSGPSTAFATIEITGASCANRRPLQNDRHALRADGQRHRGGIGQSGSGFSKAIQLDAGEEKSLSRRKRGIRGQLRKIRDRRHRNHQTGRQRRIVR